MRLPTVTLFTHYITSITIQKSVGSSREEDEDQDDVRDEVQNEVQGDLWHPFYLWRIVANGQLIQSQTNSCREQHRAPSDCTMG